MNFLRSLPGRTVFSYGSRTDPDDRRLVAQIETLLSAP